MQQGYHLAEKNAALSLQHEKSGNSLLIMTFRTDEVYFIIASYPEGCKVQSYRCVYKSPSTIYWLPRFYSKLKYGR